MNLNKISNLGMTTILLILIIYISISTRLSTLSAPTVLDYDPWWQYRQALDLLNNNMQVPKWDFLSFFPPGRPSGKTHGWEYMMAIFFKITSFFVKISFMEVAKWAPAITVGLAVIPAFFLGRFFSNTWGGLATALFATLTPTFIGVSMAGYCDTDAVAVFYSFLCVYSVFLALKKKSIPYYCFAIVSNLAFAYTWTGWLVFMLFITFTPALIIFRFIEDIIHRKKLRFDPTALSEEVKTFIVPLLIVILTTSIVGQFIGLSNALERIPFALTFTGIMEQDMLVNISVAELQTVNIFTKEGLFALVGRIGLAPVLFSFFGLPLLVLYKIYKKEKIIFTEIFIFLWVLVMFYIISRGVRFSLLFSTATATSAGYVVGNLVKYLKKDVIRSTVLGFTTLLIMMFVSEAIQVGYASGGMEISQNWYDALDWLKEKADKNSLIATWWDPGHIIAGYTGLHVHADGAHCGPKVCIPYNHNIRIQDMGRIFSTNSEDEAVTILKKYNELTPEQIKEIKETFVDKVPEEAFKPVSDIYLIASSDLIGKYYWMSFFGDCLKKFGLQSADVCYTNIEWFKNNAQGRNFIQLPFSSQDAQGNLNYGGIITLTMKDGQLVPIINVPQQGIRNAIIKELVFYQNGQEQRLSYGNVTNMVDGMLWVDPSFRVVIFMDSEVMDSIFTKLFFFNGDGLEHFELKYSNPELKIYKVIF